MTTIELGRIYQDRLTRHLGVAIAVFCSLYEETSVLLSALTVGQDGKRVEEFFPISRLKLDTTDEEDWGDRLPARKTVTLSVEEG